MQFNAIQLSEANWRPEHTERLMAAAALIQSRQFDAALEILEQESKERGPSLERCWMISTCLLYQGKRSASLENVMHCGYPADELQSRVSLLARQFLTEKGAQLFQRGKDDMRSGRILEAREIWISALDSEAENAEILEQLLQLDHDRGETQSAQKFQERLSKLMGSELRNRTYGPAPQPNPQKKIIEENQR